MKVDVQVTKKEKLHTELLALDQRIRIGSGCSWTIFFLLFVSFGDGIVCLYSDDLSANV